MVDKNPKQGLLTWEDELKGEKDQHCSRTRKGKAEAGV